MSTMELERAAFLRQGISSLPGLNHCFVFSCYLPGSCRTLNFCDSALNFIGGGLRILFHSFGPHPASHPIYSIYAFFLPRNPVDTRVTTYYKCFHYFLPAFSFQLRCYPPCSLKVELCLSLSLLHPYLKATKSYFFHLGMVSSAHIPYILSLHPPTILLRVQSIQVDHQPPDSLLPFYFLLLSVFQAGTRIGLSKFHFYLVTFPFEKLLWFPISLYTTWNSSVLQRL